MMPPAFPSLFFIGICKMICPFPNFNCQVQFALAVLDGSVTLPSVAQMEDEVRRELKEKVEAGSPAAPLADNGTKSVGVLPDSGSHRRLPTSGASCTQLV
ncbi:Flavin-containing monooxygenase FMO GS-OX-like 2 [Larimichthys crocea]|uniref:Uncharacterized protein n=1 Tax=Larimichthys crocea TaxID=215358 RepID=A0ACD3R4T0_LARCR|nr:Flavin-containing monooxygenase FMO GS-OX-like 2 [Larimichthys crocea]